MSDLQDLIARNAVMAYNEGLERGAIQEREQITTLLKGLQDEFQKSYQLERYIAVAVKRINE